MNKTGNPLRLLTWVFILAVVILTIYRLRPPDAVSDSAPPTEFASARAMQHLRVIASTPHPIASPAKAVVRAYLIDQLNKLGLPPETQPAGEDQDEEAPPPGEADTRTINVMARMSGSGAHDKAVMLVAHYDSINESYGACDDGAGVAALLETARALKAGPALSNDVIFLFTDGEEDGLLGGKAFAREHPWAKDVAVVLNFDARGCRGPVFMFETSDNNGWLISEFAKASPRPFASSLMYEIYISLRYYWTDLSAFKKEGMSGLNFAFVDEPLRQHTEFDNLKALDEGSLQHEGSYALALTRHFGNLEVKDPKTTEAVFFDVLGLALIRYPITWVKPLTILAVVLFIGLVIFGWRRKQLTIAGLALGFVAFLLSIGCSAFIAKMLWEAMRGWHHDYTSFSNYRLYLLSFAAFTLAVTALIYFLFNKKVGVNDLYVGALLPWVIITVLASSYLPRASYLFIWPLLFSLAGAAFLLTMKERFAGSPALFLVLSLCAVPGLILLTNTIYIVSLGLGLSQVPLLIALEVLLLGLLIPHIILAAPSRRWLLPVISVAVGLTFLIIANMKPVQMSFNATPGAEPSTAVASVRCDTSLSLQEAPLPPAQDSDCMGESTAITGSFLLKPCPPALSHQT
jgi:hypothetical protein